MKTKGQAAMEFLMTYGWAILAAIIVIGVLAIYFKPSTLVSNSAIVSAPFYLNAFSMTATTDTIRLELRNNGGEDVDLTSAQIVLTQPASTVTCVAGTVAIPVSPIEAGSLFTVDIVCDGGAGLLTGDTVSGTITILYQRTGSDIDLASTGSISGKVP